METHVYCEYRVQQFYMLLNLYVLLVPTIQTFAKTLRF